MAELETPLRRLRSCPLAIVCGKPEEIPTIAKELQALTTISGTSVEGINNGHSFKIGKFEFEGGKILRFYVTSSLKQGLVFFSIYTGALFSVLRPRFAIHAGVCAGNANAGIKLKDVICGDSAMSFEDGKWGMRNGQLQFMPDFETVHMTITEMPAFTENKDEIHYGSFVSGSAVREDASHIFQKIENTVTRKVLALDMEASAFLKLCQHTDVQSLGVIKGVSDLGDEDKTKDKTIYASALKKTGDTVRDWIRHWFESMTWEPNEGDEPGARLSKGYYENFVRLIGDSIHAGYNVKALEQTGKTALKIQQPIGLKIVMPLGDRVEYYAEQGQIEALAKKYNLRSVSTGGKSFTRTLYYKKRFLVDFPRTLNSLKYTSEADYQALVFKRVLQKEAYCSDQKDGIPTAEVMSWDEFHEMFGETAEAPDTQLVPMPVRSATVGLGSGSEVEPEGPMAEAPAESSRKRPRRR